MADRADLSRQLRIVEKIPFVRGLTVRQIQQVLRAGKVIRESEGAVLCRDGDKSITMFILLSGELSVRDGNVELAFIEPVEIVGEMGLVTNQPRCATIQVAKDATLISVERMRFDVLLKNDVDMAAKIYKNMLDSLSQKLRDNNSRLKKSRSQQNLGIAASVV